MAKVSLLPAKFVYGKNKLEIFEQSTNNVRAYRTDYVSICGGSDYWMTKIENTSRINVVRYSDEMLRINEWNDTSVGLRPIVYYNNISSKISNKYENEDGILEIEYGEYPQTVVSDELSNELEEQFQNNRLSRGKSYIFNVSRTLKKDGQFPTPKFSNLEYLYKGHKYVRVKPLSFTSGECLSNGLRIETSKYYWVKVEPIKWLVDKKTGICLSKYIITTGEKPRLVYFMLKYYFAAEIEYNYKNNLNHNSEKIKTNDKIESNQKTDEIAKIIDEINKYQKYYYGKIDIADKITKLINEYNHKITNILPSDGIMLTLDNNNREEIYLKLLTELNEILNGLKLNYENNKVYHDILELLDKILNNQELDHELAKDISVIWHIILPYLENEHYIKLFKEILLDKRNYVIDELTKMSNLDTKVNGKYKSMVDFELDLRQELQLFLMSIYKDIIDKNIIDDIIKNTKDIANSNYNESRNIIIKVYINTINELINDIKNRGNKLETDKANMLLNELEINNLNDTISSLTNLIKELYKIIFDINDRDNNFKNMNKYIIDTRKIKIKTQ